EPPALPPHPAGGELDLGEGCHGQVALAESGQERIGAPPRAVVDGDGLPVEPPDSLVSLQFVHPVILKNTPRSAGAARPGPAAPAPGPEPCRVAGRWTGDTTRRSGGGPADEVARGLLELGPVQLRVTAVGGQ